ncbi:Hormone-sensitive lipase [Halotydeus destructor]|nr:Hormone-sensitive lipase [Halotydeus destructor]
MKVVPSVQQVCGTFDDNVLTQDLSNLVDKLRELFKNDIETLERLEKFYHHLEDVSRVAPKYDVDGVRANGYWSWLRIWIKLFDSVLVTSVTKESAVSDFALLMKMAESWPDIMASLRETGDEGTRRTAWEDLFYALDEQLLEVTVKEHMIGLPFGDKTRILLRHAVQVLGFLYAKGVRQKVKCALSWDHAARCYTDFLMDGSVELIHSFLCVSQKPLSFTGAIYKTVRNFPKSRKVTGRTLKLETSQLWTFDRQGTTVSLTKRTDHKRVRIRCRLVTRLTNSSDNYNGKVLIYLHGGAFLGPSADSYENTYVGQWADRLRGLAILCIDFPKGPDVKFPNAVQAVLDFYLWLTSNDISVQQALGFKPSEILLSGESSGGNIASALLVALNDIRHWDDTTPLVMPKTLICFYPKIGLEYELFPSAFLQAFDPFINKHNQLKITDAYIPKLAMDESGQWTEVSPRCRDWTTRQAGGLILRSPYLSPYTYSKFDQMADIRLSLMVLHFCPFMDEGLELARRWKGPRKVQAVDGAFHPCLSAASMTPEAAAGAEVAFTMIKDSLSYS